MSPTQRIQGESPWRVLGALFVLIVGCTNEETATTATTATTVTTATTATATTGLTSGESTSGGSESAGTRGHDPTSTSGALSTSFPNGGSSGWWETSSGTTGEVCDLNIDIVFVMDVSTSMAAILQTLEEEILAVDAAIQALGLPTAVHYGLVVFVDDALIVAGGAPYVDVQALKMDFNTWRTFTQGNTQVSGMGSNFDWPENTLDALFLAAGAFQWRPIEQTLRIIIHTTDDTFGEKGAVQSGVTIMHGYDETVQALQEREVRVFTFADKDMSGGPGDDEDVSMGFFTPYQGKTPIPAATDGGAFNINEVYQGKLSLSAAITNSVVESLCMQYIPT